MNTEPILEPILESIINIEPILESIINIEPILEDILEPISNIPLSHEIILKNDYETDLLNKTDYLSNYVKCSIGESGILTSLNIVSIVNKLIHNVEKYDKLKGSEKKMLILDTLKKYNNDQNCNYSENNIKDLLEKQLLFIFIDNTLPQLIDTIVSAINGKNKFIKTKQKPIFVLLKKLFCCK
jgi:hypothetical protein